MGNNAASCRTVPCFLMAKVVAYIPAFAHPRRRRWPFVPVQMPGTAATGFEEGIAIPPVNYSEGVRTTPSSPASAANTAVRKCLSADLDSEIQAA